MTSQQLKIITILSIILSVALAVVSYYGAFIPETYERDEISMAVQGIGQDLFDLFFIVPLLLITLFFVHKENKPAFLIFSGVIFYILYSFFIYCFGVHFNNLFLLYCLILGTSLYTFIIMIIQLRGMDVKEWFKNKAPLRTVGFYFLIIALMFYFLWLKDLIPAIINKSVPQSVSDYNLLVNPVHVLDIAIVLPGLIISALSLLKKKQAGFIFAPIFLVFILLLGMALIAMGIMLKVKGISEDLSIAVIFSILAIINFILLFIFIKAIKPQK